MPDGAIAAVAAPASIEELRSQIQAIADREHIAGVAFALVDREGPTYVGGIGERDRDSHAPMTGDTAFRVGSLSKSIVALAVMRLVDQGKLDVDRPLRELVPDLEIDNPWEAEAPVTLAQCLEHTAGFDDFRFNEIYAATEDLPLRDALAINPRSRVIRWKPGTRSSYSNVGYSVAARAVEVASGEPFDVYIQREILAPLGITDADFQRSGDLSARLATGYMETGPVAYHPFAHRPSASLLASAADLAKVVHFFAMRGEGFPPIVSKAGIARIERSGTLPYGHLDTEYGFANYGDVRHPVLGRGHDGGMPGFHSAIRYFPSLGQGYVMMLNSNYTFRGYFEIRALLFAYLTRGQRFPKPLPATPTEPPAASYYRDAAPHNEVFAFMDRVRSGFFVEDFGYYAHMRDFYGWHTDLVPAVGGGYRRTDEYGSSVEFARAGDGTPILVMSGSYTEAMNPWLARLQLVALGFAVTLVKLAPIWGAIALAWRRKLRVVMWPAIAGLALWPIDFLLRESFMAGVIGQVHPYTVALCACTIVFPIASFATLISTVRWCFRKDRPHALALVPPMIFGLAFTGFALWLIANHAFAFRTWAW
ncbi:MAG: serine hydrolase domain-containing protein [Kofleriaceae bacterium]